MKRYPGIRPFTAEHQHLFYGREEEQRELFQMVILNDIVVLFGKSGTGKSSLLNAGVCPQFEDRNLHPVFIRLNNTNVPPEKQVYEFLKEHSYIPQDMPEGLTLWEYFKRFWYVDLGEVYTPVIILDQFEELFTLYTPEERQNFIEQFADVVNNRMPASLKKNIKNLDQRVDWETPPEVKFILAIRSDYLYLLNELSADIPSILRIRFELHKLKRTNATQAIILPAMADGAFDSPVFQYEEEALNEIIEVLGKRGADELRGELPDSEAEIEAFQLQLFCQQIENRIIAENRSPGFKVTSDFFGGKEGVQKIIGEFYSEVISRIPQEKQEAVETMIATFLIRNRRRIMMEESAIKEETGISQEILDQLHEERLLRKEIRTGNFYYELSHDTLLAPVLEKYQHIAVRLERERREQERLAKEKELAAIREEAEKERQRAEEQMQLRKAAEKNAVRARRRTRQALVALAIAVVFAVAALIFYGLAKGSALDAAKSLIKARSSACKAQKALEQAKQEELTAAKAQYEQHFSLGNGLMTNEPPDYKTASSEFDAALEALDKQKILNQQQKTLNQQLDTLYERDILCLRDTIYQRDTLYQLELTIKSKETDSLKNICNKKARLKAPFEKLMREGETLYNMGKREYANAIRKYRKADGLNYYDKEVHRKIKVIIDKLPELVELLEDSKGKFKEAEGDKGQYVNIMEEYIGEIEPFVTEKSGKAATESEEVAKVKTQYVQNSTGNLGTYRITKKTSLRADATSSSKVLLRLKIKTPVVVLEKQEKHWWKVIYRGQVGYVKALLLESI